MKVCRAVLILVLSFAVLLGLSCGKKGPTISTTSLPNGEVGVGYSQTLAATGGIAPYTWSIPSGSLPSWATLSSSSGTITGMPTTFGIYRLSVEVTDSVGRKAKANLSIPIVLQNMVLNSGTRVASNEIYIKAGHRFTLQWSADGSLYCSILSEGNYIVLTNERPSPITGVAVSEALVSGMGGTVIEHIKKSDTYYAVLENMYTPGRSIRLYSAQLTTS